MTQYEKEKLAWMHIQALAAGGFIRCSSEHFMTIFYMCMRVQELYRSITTEFSERDRLELEKQLGTLEVFLRGGED